MELPSPALQARFDLGHTLEAMAARDIEDALSARLALNQVPFDDKASGISGKIDGVVLCPDGKTRPVEIKSMASVIFNQFSDDPHSLEDFQRYPWTRKYPAQLQIYMYLTNHEEGILLLVSTDGRYKEKILKRDLDFVDSLLKKGEAVNKHVAAGTLPDYYDDAEHCEDCPFFHYCRPPLKGSGGPFITTNEELHALLKIYDVGRATSKEFDHAYKRIKGFVGEREEVLCGNYRITTKKRKDGALLVKIHCPGDEKGDV